VRVAPEDSLPPLDSWGKLELSSDPPPGVGEHVVIIQHPGGGAKQIALTANQVVNLFEHRLQYTTDTLPGSSGSPVFNDAWKVVALHHAGGNLVTNPRGDRMFANQGILMAKILERLKS
jgi:V8-like Glu-specific endopeptidase